MKKSILVFIAGVFVGAIGLFVTMFTWNSTLPIEATAEPSYAQFVEAVRAGRVSNLSIGPVIVDGLLTDGTAFRTYASPRVDVFELAKQSNIVDVVESGSIHDPPTKRIER